MPIVQQGSVNTTALVVPDLYVQIVPPRQLTLNGVPSNIVGLVGTASWGPVGEPVIVASAADYAREFGPIRARKHDMGTLLATAAQQGARDFRCVRVSDGTDTAAHNAAPGTTVVFTARHTGSLGSEITLRLTPGARADSWRLAIALPGQAPEVFDNISGAGNAFWRALAQAVNAGQGPRRGPSRLVSANDGGAVAAPAEFSIRLGDGAEGSDGAGGVSAPHLLGYDILPRTGMYALRGQGCAIAALADVDSPTHWLAQAAFGLEEGCYMVLTGPAGDSISNAVAAKRAAGLDSHAAKLMFGDWLWWQDAANDVVRLVSPQGFVAGRLANLSPEQSALNKPLYGILGSERSGLPGSAQVGSHSQAELAALLNAGIDVIANPQPAGAFWGVRGGRNAASNPAVNGDNYTRLTNYIAASLGAGMGQYVGQVVNADLFRRIRATLMSFLQAMQGQGLLGTEDGAPPFAVLCDATNNPPQRTGLGYVQADVQLRYQAINEKFIVNLEGGQTVQVARQILPDGIAA